VHLEIRDASGTVLAAFSSDALPEGGSGPVRDMATNFTEIRVSRELTKNPGLNRFRWDMTLPGPWNPQEGRRYQNGPLARPGRYTAVLHVGEARTSAPFELVPDPRVVASGVSESDVDAQVGFLLRIRDKVSETLRLQDDLDKKIAELKKAASPTEAEKRRLETLQGVLAKIKTEEGIYMQPMLADQWRYLYSMMDQADQAPGKDALDRFEALSAQLAALKRELEE
jgi:hypothetical protein